MHDNTERSKNVIMAAVPPSRMDAHSLILYLI